MGLGEDKILSAVSGTLVEKPKYRFTVQVDWQMPLSKWWLVDWWLRKVRRVKPETEREFIIKPCKVGNMERVAGTAVKLPKQILEGERLTQAIMPLMAPHKDDLVYIIACAIQNNCEEPDPVLVKFINKNFDSLDVCEGFNAALDGLEMQSFLNSIVLAGGTAAVLRTKASPVDGSE